MSKPQPDFCDLNFPNSLYETYRDHEIWACTDTSFDPKEGLVHRPIYYERYQPNKSWAWTVEEVRAWIDAQIPENGIKPEKGCLMMAIFGSTLIARAFPYLRLFRDLVLPEIVSRGYYQFSAWILSIV